MLSANRSWLLGLLGVLAIGASSVEAHHSSTPHFDPDTPVNISGVVTRFRFVNPHAYVYLDVTNSEGEVSAWNCEMAAASLLRRHGWTKELFSPGTQVSINGTAARRDSNGCAFQNGTLADGTLIERSGPITRPTKPETVVADSDPSAGNAQTSLLGLWITAPRAGGPPGRGPNPFAEIVTEAGKAALEHYDMRFDDPALSCSPSSLIRGWGEPDSVSEVTRDGDTITIKHEYMDTVRMVDLSTREHPTEIEPSLTGHSVGWFEGSDLVIETVGFKAGVLLPHPGLLHSEDMRIVERLSLSEDGTQLIRDFEVFDPRFLKKTFAGASRWNRSDIPLGTYDCTELSGKNNQRSLAMDIIVFGATGTIGQAIVDEALSRGHTVSGVSRSPEKFSRDEENFRALQGNPTDAASITEVTDGADAIIVAVGGREARVAEETAMFLTAEALSEALADQGDTGPQIVIIAGGTSTRNSREEIIENLPPHAPEGSPMYALFMGHWASYQVYKSSDLNWTFITPPMNIRGFRDGTNIRTGKYRTSTTDFVKTADGKNSISMSDLAAAALDLAENRTFNRTKVAIGD